MGFLINHKPDRLTGLYYDLHDKQLTNQKAVDSSGSYKELEKLYSTEMGPCTPTCGSVHAYVWCSLERQYLLITMELQPESESAAVSPSLLAAIETRAAKPVSRRFDIRMRDFMEGAAFCTRKSTIPVIEKEKSVRRSTAPSSSKHFQRDMTLQPI